MQDFQAGTSIVAACLIHGIRIAEDACFSHHSALLVYFFLKGRSWRGVFCHVEDFILWWPGQCCRRILVTMLGNPRRKNRKHSNKCLSSWNRIETMVRYFTVLLFHGLTLFLTHACKGRQHQCLCKCVSYCSLMPGKSLLAHRSFEEGNVGTDHGEEHGHSVHDSFRVKLAPRC